MKRAIYTQADLVRIFKAAKQSESIVRIDLRTMCLTVYPSTLGDVRELTGLAPDGPENWDDEELVRKLPDDFALL